MLKLQLLLKGFNIYSWPCKHIIKVVYLYKEIGGVGKLLSCLFFTYIIYFSKIFSIYVNLFC